MFNPSTQHGSRSRQGKPERFWGWGWGKAVRGWKEVGKKCHMSWAQVLAEQKASCLESNNGFTCWSFWLQMLRRRKDPGSAPSSTQAQHRVVLGDGFTVGDVLPIVPFPSS